MTVAACAARANVRSAPAALTETAAPAIEAPFAAGARYKGTIDMGGRSVHVRVDFYAATPDRVRAEIASPLGQPLASIVMRGDQVLILWPRERAWWSGGAGGSAQAGLPGGGATWVSVLLGDRAALRRLPGAIEAEDGDRIRVTLPIEGAPGVRLEFPPETGLPPESIDSSPSADLVIHLTLGVGLEPPDPERSFSLDAPEGFSRWSEFDLPAMIGASD